MPDIVSFIASGLMPDNRLLKLVKPLEWLGFLRLFALLRMTDLLIFFGISERFCGFPAAFRGRFVANRLAFRPGAAEPARASCRSAGCLCPVLGAKALYGQLWALPVWSEGLPRGQVPSGPWSLVSRVVLFRDVEVGLMPGASTP